MGLTTPLFTALSGLNANSTAISVAGNNIANVNTTAFKNSRASFETQISETLSQGSAPSTDLGGSNQVQIGLGTRVGSITRNFGDGSLQPTGVNTDLAVEGAGFFVVNFAGETRYTRAGGFSLNSEFNLVNSDGGLLQGYGIDEDFNIIEGVLDNVNIPLGALTVAKATDSVMFSGNLNSGGDIATKGTIINSSAMFTDTSGAVPALGTDSLTALFDDTGTSLFTAGDILTITNATKGGTDIPDHTFEIGGDPLTTTSDVAGSTVDDLLTFIHDVLGIHDSIGDGASVSLDAGAIRIQGNTGKTNDIELNDINFVLDRGGTRTVPLDFGYSQFADGESIKTTFVAFDSLGTPMTISLNMILENKSDVGTTWRFFADSEDNTELSTAIGTGLLNFNTKGDLTSVIDDVITIRRDDTGAITLQDISLGFLDSDEPIASRNDDSNLLMESQDGSPVGTLDNFSINNNGTIEGNFTNGLNRNLGQVVLSTFVNPHGLLDVGGNLFDTTSTSGNASILSPGSSGAGRVVGGALELSNVDLSQEFINLIISSTGFSANSRVLSTSDELIQELLATVR